MTSASSNTHRLSCAEHVQMGSERNDGRGGSIGIVLITSSLSALPFFCLVSCLSRLLSSILHAVRNISLLLPPSPLHSGLLPLQFFA